MAQEIHTLKMTKKSQLTTRKNNNWNKKWAKIPKPQEWKKTTKVNQ